MNAFYKCGNSIYFAFHWTIKKSVFIFLHASSTYSRQQYLHYSSLAVLCSILLLLLLRPAVHLFETFVTPPTFKITIGYLNYFLIIYNSNVICYALTVSCYALTVSCHWKANCDFSFRFYLVFTPHNWRRTLVWFWKRNCFITPICKEEAINLTLSYKY
jgi:hypothetical protein